MTIFGWDASDYDWSRGPMDLQAAKNAGISFFTHKSTEHATNGVFRHVHFGEAIRRAKAAGVSYYGTYIVPRSGVAVSTQIATAVAYLDSQVPGWRSDPRFFVQVDLEKWPYDSVPASVGEDMVRQIRNNFGKKVLMYASKGQYGNQISADMLKWNANYAPEHAPTRDFKQVYAATGGDTGPGWAPYGSNNSPALIWQYASDTTIGSQKQCDANAFRGTLAEFGVLVSTDTNPTPVVNPAQLNAEIPKWSTVTMCAVGLIIAEIMRYYPKSGDLYITSGSDGDHAAVSHHYCNLSWNGSPTAAVDFGAGGVTSEGNAKMRDFAKWLYDNYSSYFKELIHSTPYADDQGFYVLDGIKRPNGGGVYSQATRDAHLNHIHVAMSKATADQLLAKLRAEATPAPIPVAPEEDEKVITFFTDSNVLYGFDGTGHWRIGDLTADANKINNMMWIWRGLWAPQGWPAGTPGPFAQKIGNALLPHEPWVQFYDWTTHLDWFGLDYDKVGAPAAVVDVNALATALAAKLPANPTLADIKAGVTDVLSHTKLGPTQ